jgi:tetratricopeptide (TPR) repeat protein
MLVISHNTALTYRNKPVDTKLIDRELGVRYVLEGSVRRSSSRVRINAQLIDAETDAHLWAERFDGDTSDLFALQDEITSQIGFALNIELALAEATRPTEHPDALDYIFRGRALFQGRSPSRNSYAEAIRLLDQALALDPQSAEAQTWLAGVLVNRVNTFTTDTPAADLARAEELIDRALAASRQTSFAHYVKGTVLRNRNRWDEPLSSSKRRSLSTATRSAHYRDSAGVYSILDRWMR